MAFSYGKDIKVLNIRDNSQDRVRFEALLAPRGQWTDPAMRLKKLLQPACHGVVIEDNYIDEDYRAGFARFHYMRHHDTQRRCQRLHFFSSPIPAQGLINLPTQLIKSYLGFTVIRPLPAFRFGRTILSPKLIETNSSVEEKYVTCVAPYHANLAGNEIDFLGVPWLQQDTLVSACASAALWVGNVHMAHKFPNEYSIYHTCDITDLATRQAMSTGRAMPSMGLTNEQMMLALQDMGYDPLPYQPLDQIEAHNIAYRYVESGLPVITGFFYLTNVGGRIIPNGHAVTIVGHTFDMQRDPIIEKLKIHGMARPLRFCRTANFAAGFLVQDDAGGPFRRLELLDWDFAIANGYIEDAIASQLRNRYACLVLLDGGSPTQEVAALGNYIVPLPQGVTLDGYAAEERAIELTGLWYQMTGHKPPAVIVARTFLKPSNVIKDSLNINFGTPRGLSREVRRHLMSKWVWITEIADLKELRSSHSILGGVIQDSASHPTSTDYFDCIAFYMPGFVLLQRPDGSFIRKTIPEYSSLLRFTASKLIHQI